MHTPITVEIKSELVGALKAASIKSNLSFMDIIEQAIVTETNKINKAQALPKDALLVTLIRERQSENERYRDDYLFEQTDDPEQKLREAVREFLLTDEGAEAIKDSSEDFNWGDAVMYTPDDILQKHGIYEVPQNGPQSFGGLFEIIVNQDEILIPDEYWQTEE